MNSAPASRRRGFSLIELVIVLTITALLMSLAVPAYEQYLDRSHRTQAVARLMAVAGCQERVRTVQGAYDADRCLPVGQARYAFAYAPNGARGYLVLARPMGPQADDPCGTLMLDHLGNRRVSAARADSTRCWSGR